MKTNESLLNDLLALGGTCSEVVASLASRGIMGTRGSCYNCPIASYLRSLGYYGPCANKTMVCISGGIDIETPSSISLFIRAFDMGCYDFLVTSLPGMYKGEMNV